MRGLVFRRSCYLLNVCFSLPSPLPCLLFLLSRTWNRMASLHNPRSDVLYLFFSPHRFQARASICHFSDFCRLLFRNRSRFRPNFWNLSLQNATRSQPWLHPITYDKGHFVHQCSRETKESWFNNFFWSECNRPNLAKEDHLKQVLDSLMNSFISLQLQQIKQVFGSKEY